MSVSETSRTIAAAQRGRIVQRVLVEGWSPAQAAAAFGLRERQIARWVADYRNRGMASLREDCDGEHAVRRGLRRLRTLAWRWCARLDRKSTRLNSSHIPL